MLLPRPISREITHTLLYSTLFSFDALKKLNSKAQITHIERQRRPARAWRITHAGTVVSLINATILVIKQIYRKLAITSGHGCQRPDTFIIHTYIFSSVGDTMHSLRLFCDSLSGLLPRSHRDILTDGHTNNT